jgi:hypothetical protein
MKNCTELTVPVIMSYFLPQASVKVKMFDLSLSQGKHQKY